MSQPKVIRTHATVEAGTSAQLLEFLSIYWLLSWSPPEIEQASDQTTERVLSNATNLLASVTPLLSRKGLGLSPDDIKLFSQQLQRWSTGAIDWDNTRQYNAYVKREGIFFTDIYSFLIENPEELSKAGRAVLESFSEDELALIEAMLGLILGYGRRYTGSRITTKIKKAISSLFPLVAETLRTGTDVSDDGADYEAPGWLTDVEAIVQNVINSHPDLDVVRSNGDGPQARNLTFENSSLQKLKENFPEDHKVYSSNYKKLVQEAFNCIVANLKMNLGQPLKLASLHRLIRGDGIYLPPNMIASENFSGYVSLEKTSTGKYGLMYYSPFLEVLDKGIRGNVIENKKYTRGSTEFVCKYIDPTSRVKTANYAYTLEARKLAIDNTYAQADSLISNVSTYRKRWVSDMVAMTKAVSSYDVKLTNALRKVDNPEDAKLPTPVKSTILRNGILGLMCELGYQVAPRVGGRGNSTLTPSGRVPTYALTTLRLRHVITTPRNLTVAHQAVQDEPASYSLLKQSLVEVVFDYLGKKAEHQFHKLSRATLSSEGGGIVTATQVLDALSAYMALITRQLANHEVAEDGLSELDLRQKSQFFKVPNAHDSSTSKWVDVHNRMLNSYLKSRIKFPGDQTFKAFRKLKATELFNQYMLEVEGSLTKDNIDAHIMKASASAGQGLGHAAAKAKSNGTMALSYYIVPSVVRSYYQKVGAEPVSKIAKILNQNLREDSKE